MPSRFLGPVQWRFRGDTALCQSVMPQARVVAGWLFNQIDTGPAGVSHRVGRANFNVGDDQSASCYIVAMAGSGARQAIIDVFVGPVQSKGLPATPGGGGGGTVMESFFESGLWTSHIDIAGTQLIYPSSDLLDRWAGPGITTSWAWTGHVQGTGITGFIWAGPPDPPESYHTQATDAQVTAWATTPYAATHEATKYSGLLRGLVQAAGPSRNLARELSPTDAGGGLLTQSFQPNCWGLARNRKLVSGSEYTIEYFLVRIDGSNGITAWELEIANPDVVALAIHELANHRTGDEKTADWIELEGPILRSLCNPKNKFTVSSSDCTAVPIAYGWHWNEDGSKAAIVDVVEYKETHDFRDHGYFECTLIEVDFDWNDRTATVARGTTKVTRLDHTVFPLWVPDPTTTGLMLVYNESLPPAYGMRTNMDDHVPFYCWYDDDGSIETLDYVNYAITTSTTTESCPAAVSCGTGRVAGPYGECWIRVCGTGSYGFELYGTGTSKTTGGWNRGSSRIAELDNPSIAKSGTKSTKEFSVSAATEVVSGYGRINPGGCTYVSGSGAWFTEAQLDSMISACCGPSNAITNELNSMKGGNSSTFVMMNRIFFTGSNANLVTKSVSWGSGSFGGIGAILGKVCCESLYLAKTQYFDTKTESGTSKTNNATATSQCSLGPTVVFDRIRPHKLRVEYAIKPTTSGWTLMTGAEYDIGVGSCSAGDTGCALSPDIVTTTWSNTPIDENSYTAYLINPRGTTHLTDGTFNDWQPYTSANLADVNGDQRSWEADARISYGGKLIYPTYPHSDLIAPDWPDLDVESFSLFRFIGTE